MKLIAEKRLKEEQEKTREIQFHEIYKKEKEKLQQEFRQVEDEEESKESFPTKASTEDIYHFGSISFYPSTPPLPARRAISPLKSPTNGVTSLQWSPINTMSPNRYVPTKCSKICQKVEKIRVITFHTKKPKTIP